MLKYDEYIHCFTFLDYLTQSFYLTLYHFIEVIFLSFFRNARSLFCSSSSSWEKKDWGKYSFQTWPLVCNFICISWCAIITNYWHILMEWVSLAEIFALYHWKKKRVTKDFLSRQIWAMKNKSYNNSKRFYWIHEL